MTKTNKIIIWVIAILAVVAIAFVLSTHKASADKVEIGALFPLTGGLASYGEPAQKSAQLAVDEINAAGGINGKHLEINFQDHKCDPKLAVTAYQSLHSQGVKTYLEVACSGAVLSVAPQLNDSVLLVSAATSPKISKVSPYVFRNYASDDNESKLFADQIIKSGYKNVGVIFEETDYAKGLEVDLEKYLAGSGVNVIAEGFTANSTDVKTQVSKIKSDKVDAVFVSVQTVTTGDVVLGEIEKQGYKPANLIVNENILKSSQLLSKYSNLLEGATSADYITNDNPALTKMLDAYKAKYGVDCPQKNICATVYDNVYILAEAIKTNGYDANAIKTYLASSTYNGSSGTIGFDQNNDRSNANYTLFKIEGGKVVVK